MILRFAPALLLVLATPAPAQDASAGITSNQPASTVSLATDPQVSDGRLVLRMAAQNRGTAPVTFGPTNVRLTLAGKPVALIPLAKLIADVSVAAGLSEDEAFTDPAAPAITTTGTGQKDVSGYTGNMGMSAAPVRAPGKKRVSAQARAAAEQQIAGLKAGILSERSVAPGEVAAGQLVTEKFKLRGRDRAVEVIVTVGGDTHSFKLDLMGS